MRAVILYLFLFLTSSFTNLVFAQTDTLASTPLLQLQLKDGNIFIGELMSEDANSVVLRPKGMENIRIQKDQIKSRKLIPISNYKNGQYWFDNPNAHRYLYGPSGYSLEKGTGYYQNFMLFYNSVSYGFSDRITAGLGIIPYTFGEGLFFSLQAKYAIPIVENKWSTAIGVQYINAIGEQVGIGYGVLTYGSKDHHLTLGAGYGWSEDNLANAPIITISGMTRLGRKFGIVSENWLLPQEEGIYEINTAGEYVYRQTGTSYNLLYGLSCRYIGESLTIDFGVVGIDAGAIPLVGVVLPF